MRAKHNMRWTVLALAGFALFLLAGAYAGLVASVSQPIASQASPTAVDVATPQEAIPEPTEASPPPAAESSWRQEARGQLLEIPSCFDFDLGTVSGPPDPACDINFLAGRQRGSVDLYSTSGAEIGQIAADLQTSQRQCVDSSALGSEPLTVTPVSDSGVICFRTGEGKWGLLSIVDADLQTAYTVTFDWWTFDPIEEAGAPQNSASPLAYANESYGFQLTFPTSWHGYSAGELDGSGVGSVCFSFSGAMPVCVLQIDVYTHGQWDELQKLHEDYYLGENDYYVFGAGPFTEECVQMDDFQCERYRELPEVLATFEAD
jgi:hypothetical protein